MAGHVRYIRRRNVGGVYYYERRVPAEIMSRTDEWHRYFAGVTLYRRSLRTKHQAEAMRRGAEVHQDFERLHEWAVGSLPAKSVGDHATRPLTPEFLEKVSAEAHRITIKPWAQQLVLAEASEQHADELARMINSRELHAEQLLAVLTDPTRQPGPLDPNIREYVDRKIREERIDAPPGSDQRAAIARAVREAITSGERYVDDMLTGRKPIPIGSLASSRTAAPRLSQVMDDYVTGHLTAGRTIREANAALEAFVAVVGDLPVDELSRADFLRFCEVEGARVIGGKDPKSIVRPVSAQTVQKKLRLLHAAINRAVKAGRFAGPNPAAGIDASTFTKPVPKHVMPDKRPFDVHELNLILMHPWFTGCASRTNTHNPGTVRLDGMHYWVPVLAIYTGCRAGELGGLRIAEVRLDHTHPHIVVQDNDYRTTKGSYRRKVPVLDVLIEIGFGEFVNGVAREGHDRLFPDWHPPGGKVDAGSTAWSNARIIRSFNQTLLPKQLTGVLQPNVRKEVTFHGFRGAFKTLLGRREYGIPVNYIHEVVGHAKDGLDKRYVREIDLSETYQAVRRCRHEGLTLPPAP